MGLMRSLFSGVSGLRNHQLFMDVIGNNIANVNTTGFKVGRIGFSEIFAQTLKGTTQPVSNRGGTNPIQIGLGMSVSTIDTIFAQGNIESTGQVTDLALQGEGFFVVSDGARRYYTRAGGFQFNAEDTLILPGSGLKLQGYLANQDGEITAGTPITDLRLPINRKIAAVATTNVELAGNLDVSKNPLGTILETEQLYAIEEAGDNSDVEGLYASGTANGSITGLIPNSTTVTVTDGAGVSRTYIYVDADTSTDNDAFNSLDDLVAEINNDFSGSSFTASLNGAGQIVFTDDSGATNDITIDSSNPLLNQAFSTLNGDVFAGSLTSDEFSHVARADDTLVNLRNQNGVSLGLTATDLVTINAQVGGSGLPPGGLTISAGTTYLDFANQIETFLGLTNSDGVEISPDRGSLIINGDGGKAYELTNMDIRATDASGTTIRTAFNEIFDNTPSNYTERQAAKDVQQSSTTTVYDSLGNGVDLTFIFTRDVKNPNRWTWTAKVPEPAQVTGGSTGFVEFNTDGSIKQFTYDDGAASVQINPGTDADNLSINLDPGKNGSFDGITQMSGFNSSTLIASQDGYGMGVLDLISIDESGQITGSFSNGVIQLLGQIALAKFTNPGGLIRANNNLFETSGNSGDAVIGTAGDSFNTNVVSGALEQSNVDLAEEFTKMIVAQRAFQANARTITVSDDMLSEVTSLKR